MGSMFSLMDIIVAACGVYILYVFYMLKFKGEIKETLLLPKGTDLKKCKDQAAYAAEMAPKVLIFGIVVLAGGVLGMLEDEYQMLGNYYLVVVAVFLLVIVWFAFQAKRAIQKYWP